MLDIKNEQKWPLTTKNVSYRDRRSSSQGSFHLYAQEATRDYGLPIFVPAYPGSVLFAETGIFLRRVAADNSCMVQSKSLLPARSVTLPLWCGVIFLHQRQLVTMDFLYWVLHIPVRFCLPKWDYLFVAQGAAFFVSFFLNVWYSILICWEKRKPTWNL